MRNKKYLEGLLDHLFFDEWDALFIFIEDMMRRAE